jgi:hypothetical protein
VIAEDSDNGVFVEFDDQEHVAEGDPTAVPAYYYYDRSEEEYVVKKGGEELTYNSREEMEEEWSTFKGVFLPDVEFDRKPTEDDFLIMVIPNAENPIHDQPLLYEHGETIPLYDELGIDVPEHAYIREESRQTRRDLEQQRGEESKEENKQEQVRDTEDSEQDTAEQPEPAESSEASATEAESSDTEEESDTSGSVFDEVSLSRDKSDTTNTERESTQDYWFPDVSETEDLPETCPKCESGKLETKQDQPYAGPAPTLGNFPAVTAALTRESVLELGEPPLITEAIDSTVISCEDCSLAVPIYIPESKTDETNEVFDVDSPSQNDGSKERPEGEQEVNGPFGTDSNEDDSRSEVDSSGFYDV